MKTATPNIPIKFENNFPKNFQNTFPYWGFFSKKEIKQNEGKLLMLDIDLGRYCSLSCPTCFRKSNVIDEGFEGDLSYEELIKVIDDAQELGLQSVKICGGGEPMQNTKFLQFIKDMDARDIGTAVFTKGQVLGNDKEARKFNKNYGINSAQELCEELFKYKVSFMLGFQSFNPIIQDELVGKEGHTQIRNKTLENLVNAGFNESNPTRLALEVGPIVKDNIDEIFDLYVYARKRNLYVIPNFSMVSGKQFNKEFTENVDVSYNQKIDLFTKIYSWNIKNRIQTLEQIENEGISAMPGIHPCNQIACGLYLTANGNVVGCPGYTQVEGNVKEKSIKEIWEHSQNKKLRAGQFNCKCPPKDGITIPRNLYAEVLKNLEKKF